MASCETPAGKRGGAVSVPAPRSRETAELVTAGYSGWFACSPPTRYGSVTPVYEKYVLRALGIVALKPMHTARTGK